MFVLFFLKALPPLELHFINLKICPAKESFTICNQTLRRSCWRPDLGVEAGIYLPASESSSLAVFEVLPAFTQHFYLCMNSFTKFLNTPQQMRPSVVCLVSYRIYEEKTA